MRIIESLRDIDRIEENVNVIPKKKNSVKKVIVH